MILREVESEARTDRSLVIAFHLAALVVFAWSGYLIEYLVLWVLPLVTVVQAILRLRAIAEHGATTDFSSPLTAARTNVAPAWLEWLIFPHHVNYHIEHHLYASVPHYNLPALHREMRAHGVLEGAEVIRARSWKDLRRAGFDTRLDDSSAGLAEGRRRRRLAPARCGCSGSRVIGGQR